MNSFGRKMNEDVNRNRKLFWKDVSNAKEGKVRESPRREERRSEW